MADYDSVRESGNIGIYSLNARVETILDSLRLNNIIIPEPSQVTDYLINHQDVLDDVKPVTNIVNEYLDQNSRISLEVYHDPEINDSYLVVYIRQNPYSEDIMDVIDEINERIGNNVPGDISGWIPVTTDFNFPRY